LSEIPFEKFGLYPEATPGTPIGAGVGESVHQFDMPGTITPRDEMYRPQASRGTLFRNYRSKRMREWAEWTAEGDYDNRAAPLFYSMALAGGVTPTTPTSGVLTRQWIHAPNGLANDLLTSTMYFGDPNVQVFQGAFGTVDDLTITGDKAGTEAVKWSMSGRTNGLLPQAPTAWKAMNISDLFAPGNMQVWIDGPSNPIGTTDVTDLVVSASHHWVNDLAYKFGSNPGGVNSTLGYGRIGRAPRACEVTFNMEFLDLIYYNFWKNADFLKTRVRYYGPLIEAVAGPINYYSYTTLEVYGKFNAPDLSEIENTNRGWTFVIPSEVYATVGYDWRATLETTRTNLTS
jgi:hypothetical protein